MIKDHARLSSYTHINNFFHSRLVTQIKIFLWAVQPCVTAMTRQTKQEDSLFLVYYRHYELVSLILHH